MVATGLLSPDREGINQHHARTLPESEMEGRHPCEQIGYGVYCDLYLSSPGRFQVDAHDCHVMYVIPHGVYFFANETQC